MKKHLILLVFTFAGVLAYGQSPAQETPEFKKNRQIFDMATAFNDPLVARMALYNMIAADNSNPALLDSLAMLYYESQGYASVVLMSQEVLRHNPNNTLMIELSAICYENIGLPQRALEQYESLYMKQNNPVTLYKIAFLQLQLKRFVEANASADILLGKPDQKEQMLVFPKEDKSTQQVSMHAALYNMKGLVAKGQNNKELAKEMFDKALKIAPDFEIALKNVQGLLTN